jgi:hypothetical protein
MASLFPHLTATGPSPTSREVMEAYREAFAARLADGSLRPLVLPYHFWGYVILGAYLCIPHTKSPWLYTARWPVLAAILAFQWKTLWEATSMSMATGFVAGLMAAWGAIWSITWLVLYRPQFEAKRVQGRPKGRIENGSIGFTNEFPKLSNGNGGTIRKRKQEHIHAEKEQGNGHAVTNEKAQHLNPTSFDYEPGTDETIEYYWQEYPDNFPERFWWVSDLIINFRLPGCS